MKYFIKTFGCQMNIADSERIASYYQTQGYKPAKNYNDANVIIINTCVVRQKAEDKIYGLVRNLVKNKKNKKIVVTGCLVGNAKREPSGRVKKYLKERMPGVDEFIPAEKFSFKYKPLRGCGLPTQNNKINKHAWVPISNGCNNFCSYCLVPFSRGREISRPFKEIIKEVKNLAKQGYREITLLGQNVNSYGADLVKTKKYKLPDGKIIKPIMVKSMGQKRIPTLFPYLLEQVAQIKGLRKITFISSNPWDFSDELIDVIARYKNINREIHLPVQSGDNEILKKMNRWYTKEEYLDLIKGIKKKVPDAVFTTDIIVGFPGETKKQFQNTVNLCKKVNFTLAYIACYSPRPGTAAEKIKDNVPWAEKKKRFHVLDKLINKKQDSVP